MAGEKRPGLATRVKELREHVADWRRTRRRGVRMPETLWAQAVALAREGTVWSVAHKVGVKYATLRMRVESAEPSAVALVPKPTPRGFVELSGASILGVAAPGPIIEVADGAGTRMTIRLAQGDRLDVAAVVQAFRARP